MDMDNTETLTEKQVAKNRSKQKQYPESNLNHAVAAVKSKIMTLGKAASHYGYKWLELFLKRRGVIDALSIPKPESISHAAATVCESDIRKWFQLIGDYVAKENLSDILKDPRRILNGDETMFLFDPETKSVIATKGNRNVYLVQKADPKKNITVLFTFDADGYMFPPDIILPYKRLSKHILMSMQSDWGVGKSERGWMDRENFQAYIQNILYPSLVRRNVPFPVIFFVDGHSSHTGIEAAEACATLGIILIALYPNATHIMQPCDVSIFKPLKNQWTKVIDQWKMENDGNTFTIDHFGGALDTAIRTGIKTATIRAGFRRCGLFPFDVDAIDYSRCLARSSEIEAVPNVPVVPVENSNESSAESLLVASGFLATPPSPKITLWSSTPDSDFEPSLSPLPRQLSPIPNTPQMVGTSPMLLHTSSYAEDPINSETALMENVNTKSAISQTSIGIQFSRAEAPAPSINEGTSRAGILCCSQGSNTLNIGQS
ncbi:uncharacterized protein LOC134221809 [Armigeres subalbatus]|uniref:uncharacterized protein LOC134221809 n=1 Tax=Armigeres subalbatus TaxID=124917 RepID=UPI002ED15DE3